MSLLRLWILALGLLLPGAVLADDFDDFDDFDDEASDEVEGEDEGGFGQDSPEIFEDTKKRGSKMDPDDEIALWEEYLRTYPETEYYDTIQARMEKLSSNLYVIDEDEGPAAAHAKDAEMDFLRPMAFYPVNTRRGFGVQIRMGGGGYFGYRLEYEHAFLRQFSAFFNIHNRSRLMGFFIEGGAKYAIVKSVNRGLALSGGIALRVGFPSGGGVSAGAMPFVVFGYIPNKTFQLQVLVAPELPFQSYAPYAPSFHAGLMMGVRFHPAVGISIETDLRTKSRAFEGRRGTPAGGKTNSYVFADASLGLMIFPWKDRQTGQDRAEIRIGASIPYVFQIWRDYTPLAMDLSLQLYF